MGVSSLGSMKTTAIEQCLTIILEQVKPKKGRQTTDAVSRPLPRDCRDDGPGRARQRLIIFNASAEIVVLPSFSVTSPVTSTVWEMCGTIFALLSAARPPASS